MEGHDQEALARAKRAAFEGFDLWVASPEDIVLYKLQTWRTQDQVDIENLLANANALDRRYIGERLAAIEEETGHPGRERVPADRQRNPKRPQVEAEIVPSDRGEGRMLAA